MWRGQGERPRPLQCQQSTGRKRLKKAHMPRRCQAGAGVPQVVLWEAAPSALFYLSFHRRGHRQRERERERGIRKGKGKKRVETKNGRQFPLSSPLRPPPSSSSPSSSVSPAREPHPRKGQCAGAQQQARERGWGEGEGWSDRDSGASNGEMRFFHCAVFRANAADCESGAFVRFGERERDCEAARKSERREREERGRERDWKKLYWNVFPFLLFLSVSLSLSLFGHTSHTHTHSVFALLLSLPFLFLSPFSERNSPSLGTAERLFPFSLLSPLFPSFCVTPTSPLAPPHGRGALF